MKFEYTTILSSRHVVATCLFIFLVPIMSLLSRTNNKYIVNDLLGYSNLLAHFIAFFCFCLTFQCRYVKINAILATEWTPLKEVMTSNLFALSIKLARKLCDVILTIHQGRMVSLFNKLFWVWYLTFFSFCRSDSHVTENSGSN